MKRLVIIMAVLFASITTIVAQSNTEEVPFNFEISRLNNYLKLKSYQLQKVKTLNESFIQMQEECEVKGSSREQKIQQILTENLSGMKEPLSKVQFEKYVALLKITNKNNSIIDEDLLANLVEQVNGK